MPLCFPLEPLSLPVPISFIPPDKNDKHISSCLERESTSRATSLDGSLGRDNKQSQEGISAARKRLIAAEGLRLKMQ